MVSETAHDAGAEAASLREDLARTREDLARTRADLAAATEEAATWRAAALDRWSGSLRDIPTSAGGELSLLRREIDDIHRSTSWRITRPVRMAITALKALRRRR